MKARKRESDLDVGCADPNESACPACMCVCMCVCVCETMEHQTGRKLEIRDTHRQIDRQTDRQNELVWGCWLDQIQAVSPGCETGLPGHHVDWIRWTVSHSLVAHSLTQSVNHSSLTMAASQSARRMHIHTHIQTLLTHRPIESTGRRLS